MSITKDELLEKCRLAMIAWGLDNEPDKPPVNRAHRAIGEALDAFADLEPSCAKLTPEQERAAFEEYYGPASEPGEWSRHDTAFKDCALGAWQARAALGSKA